MARSLLNRCAIIMGKVARSHLERSYLASEQPNLGGRASRTPDRQLSSIRVAHRLPSGASPDCRLNVFSAPPL